MMKLLFTGGKRNNIQLSPYDTCYFFLAVFFHPRCFYAYLSLFVSYSLCITEASGLSEALGKSLQCFKSRGLCTEGGKRLAANPNLFAALCAFYTYTVEAVHTVSCSLKWLLLIPHARLNDCLSGFNCLLVAPPKTHAFYHISFLISSLSLSLKLYHYPFLRFTDQCQAKNPQQR